MKYNIFIVYKVDLCLFLLMIIDFLSAVFNHFYDIMVVNQETPTLTAMDALKKENSEEISKTAPYKVRFESEPIVLSNSANSFIEHSDASDSDKSGVVGAAGAFGAFGAFGATPPDIFEDDSDAPQLIKNPTISDFISNDTSMHEMALFVHYLQYSF